MIKNLAGESSLLLGVTRDGCGFCLAAAVPNRYGRLLCFIRACRKQRSTTTNGSFKSNGRKGTTSAWRSITRAFCNDTALIVLSNARVEGCTGGCETPEKRVS
jgi:hypothetical protein